MSKVKYIKSTRSNLVYAIERSEYKTKFRTPDNYFAHAERSTWISKVGFNTFVLYKSTWYSVDHTDYGYITILEFVEIDAEQAAEIETAKAYEAMQEASEHERKASDAAIEYDPETAKKEAQEARFSAAYAKACAKHASEYAAAAGTSSAAVSADIAGEYAAHAADDARSATETAERAAVEAIAADMLEEYGNTEDATNATAYGAFADMHDGARPDDLEPADMEQMDRLMMYAAETIATIQQTAEHIADPLAKYRSVEYLEFDEPRPTYQRHELETFLGEPDDYDVSAIEHDATAYDPATGRTVWAVDADTLAIIAERHQLQFYAPAF